jgi:uncharacterized protein
MGILILLSIGLVLLWAGIVASTAWMLTRPPRRTYASAVARGRPGDPAELASPLSFESWTFRSSTGTELPAWDVQGNDPAGALVVLTHGWADSRIGALARLSSLVPVASRVILWDLRGHGHAPGTCSLGPRERDDLAALLEHLGGPENRGRRDAPPVVLYGWSLGAGASLEVAAKQTTIAGVIAEAPYRLRATPARNVLAARGLPWRFTLGPALWCAAPLLALRGQYRGFDRARAASQLSCPLLVLHGSEDLVSPIEDGREIAAAAPRGTLIEIDGAGHNDLWGEQHLHRSAAAVQEFIRTLSADQPQRPGSLPSPGRNTLCP